MEISSMRFKLYDKVKVVNIGDEDYRDCLGAVVVIVDIDPFWSLPYEIAFENGEKYSKDLFAENEIVLYSEPKNKPQTDFIDIKFKKDTSDGASISDVIDLLMTKIKMDYNFGNHIGMDINVATTNAIARLMEAKMWADEIDKYNENKYRMHK